MSKTATTLSLLFHSRLPLFSSLDNINLNKLWELKAVSTVQKLIKKSHRPDDRNRKAPRKLIRL